MNMHEADSASTLCMDPFDVVIATVHDAFRRITLHTGLNSSQNYPEYIQKCCWLNMLLDA